MAERLMMEDTKDLRGRRLHLAEEPAGGGASGSGKHETADSASHPYNSQKLRHCAQMGSDFPFYHGHILLQCS